jgi:hypothetical protein
MRPVRNFRARAAQLVPLCRGSRLGSCRSDAARRGRVCCTVSTTFLSCFPHIRCPVEHRDAPANCPPGPVPHSQYHFARAGKPMGSSGYLHSKGASRRLRTVAAPPLSPAAVLPLVNCNPRWAFLCAWSPDSPAGTQGGPFCAMNVPKLCRPGLQAVQRPGTWFRVLRAAAAHRTVRPTLPHAQRLTSACRAGARRAGGSPARLGALRGTQRLDKPCAPQEATRTGQVDLPPHAGV